MLPTRRLWTRPCPRSRRSRSFRSTFLSRPSTVEAKSDPVDSYQARGEGRRHQRPHETRGMMFYVFRPVLDRPEISAIFEADKTIRRASYNGITRASQARDEGSTPSLAKDFRRLFGALRIYNCEGSRSSRAPSGAREGAQDARRQRVSRAGDRRQDVDDRRPLPSLAIPFRVVPSIGGTTTDGIVKSLS